MGENVFHLVINFGNFCSDLVPVEMKENVTIGISLIQSLLKLLRKTLLP